jgi:DNA topoisomerase-1
MKGFAPGNGKIFTFAGEPILSCGVPNSKKTGLMPKNLLIVESPAKAKTIEKFLGSGFKVKSSFGHVRDLEKGNNAVDIQNNFQPKYVVTPDKHKVVKELKEAVKSADEVWLATDEDREGEAISWHLCQVLGLDESKTKRIVFREITKPAIEQAVKNPRYLNLGLVNAQQARRVLDRLVGFELSEVLWRKIRGGLSAGRVQSVALKLIVEREREILNFKAKPYFRVSALFMVKTANGQQAPMTAELIQRFDTAAQARAFLERCIGAVYRIENIEVKPLRRKPAAPFTTSTLQQEASRKLGFTVQRTMNVAQRLYEAGHITYMRTDSIALSETALQSIAQEIEKQYGKVYLNVRRFKNKTANAQEAHEAIRPTYIERQQVTGSRDEQRLYELIWKRAIASQMAEAIIEKTLVDISISTLAGALLRAEGEALKFDGFLRVYLESSDDEEEEETKGLLPPLKVGQTLDLDHLAALERWTRPPSRYTEAGLVKKLEELGIGRPSTYAPTISKIMEEGRGYVVRESREGEEKAFQLLILKNGEIEEKTKKEQVGAVKNRLFPTDMGITVSDFLDDYFQDIMDYSFTAGIEEKLDDIASGGREWTVLLREFYGPFHDNVEKTKAEAGRPRRERVLGADHESGHTVVARMTRNGPVVQIGLDGELEEGQKPRYANLQPGQSIETITFEEAINLFELPRTLGRDGDKEVSVGIGRYGPYVRFGEDEFVSIPRSEDPLSITLARALELVEARQREKAPVGQYQGFPITKGSGRFGPFLKWKDLYVNVPRKYSLDTITQEQMEALIEQKLEKEANRYIQQWESENIFIENGRWGPFIRFGKKIVKIPKLNGQKPTAESAAELNLEQVKAMIEAEIPDAFAKKKSTKKK